MILQALHKLYKRIPDIDRPGFAPLRLSWALVIDDQGNLIGLEPLRIKAEKGNKLYPAQISAPSPGKRTAGDKPGFLADKTDYILGCDPAITEEKAKAKLAKRFELFREAHLAAQRSIAHPDFDAVCTFLRKWNPEDPSNFEKIETASPGTDLAEIFGSNLAFRVSGKTGFVHQLPEVTGYWSEQATKQGNSSEGFCLVSGKRAPLARLHDPAIKGVTGAQSSGASMVSFNLPAFISFAKEQSLNAPVSETAAFAYCTTLNWLLSQRARRFRLGDATTVFWTDEPTLAETLLPWMMAGVPDKEDEVTIQRVHEALDRISQGSFPADELGAPETRFYILGLSPNASRLSVRFWHTGTLGELLEHLQKHFQDLALVRQWDETNSKKPEPVAPSAYQLLRQTAREADGIPPLLSGALMRAILLGTRYPDSLVQAVMNRIRVVEKKPKGEGSLDNVTYLRAAILKAWLVRNHHQTIEIMLDENNTNLGYRLGRLFAVLEKTQQDALPSINATIRERFYASASATPRAVFGRLLRLYPNHLAKAQSEWASKIGMDNATKRKNGREICIQEILDSVTDFPAHLNLKDQAQFALGYYHQRKALFTAKEKPTEILSA